MAYLKCSFMKDTSTAARSVKSFGNEQQHKSRLISAAEKKVVMFFVSKSIHLPT